MMSENQEYINENSGIDISVFLSLFKRRFWIFVGVTIIFFSLLLIKVFKEIPEFRANTLIKINKKNIVSSIIGDTHNEDNNKSNLETQSKIFKTRSVLKIVNDSIRASEEYNGVVPQYHVSISPISNTSLLSISVTSTLPELTAKIANLIPLCYMETVRKNQKASSDEALKWLQAEIKQMKSKIEILHTKLSSYNNIDGILSGNSKQSENAAVEIQREESERKYIQAKLTRLNLENQHRAANEHLKHRENSSLSLPPYLENEITNNLIQEYSQLKIKLSEQNKFYGDKHPIITELKMKSEVMENYIEYSLKQKNMQLKQEIEYALSKEKMFYENLIDLVNEINSKKSAQFERNKIADETENANNIYKLMLKKSKEMEILEHSDLIRFSIIDEALVPSKPFKPNYPNQIVLMLLISLLFGCGAAYIMEIMDAKVSNIDKAKDLDASFMGEIEFMGKDFDINTVESNNSFLENLKSIIINLKYLIGENKKSTKLMVTSTIPEEGKSFSIINIAKWMAKEGKKVVILDMDFYRGQIFNAFKENKTIGLSNYLIDENNINEIITKTEIDNLSIIGKGKRELPVSLMHCTEKIERLFTELEKEYDLILIDTPPLKVMADILIIAKMVDAVAYVINSRKTNKWAVKRNLNKMYESGVGRIGIILNQVKKSMLNNDYYLNYYKNYYTEKSDNTSKVLALSNKYKNSPKVFDNSQKNKAANQ